MKKIILFGLAFALVSLPAIAGNYKLDAAHSQLGFKIKHLGISTVPGRFKIFDGTGSYDEKTGQLTNLKVTISADSIDTNEPDRDKHLRSPDFFDVAKFPQLTFESTQVVNAGNIPQQIKGKFSLHGVTKEITLDIVDWGGTATDPWSNERLAFEARTKIDRTEYGLTWNKGLKQAAGLLVGNEVTLEIMVEAIKIPEEIKK